MTKNQKVFVVMNCPEIIAAVKLLIAVKEDIKAKKYIRSEYVVFNKRYELKLKEITN